MQIENTHIQNMNFIETHKDQTTEEAYRMICYCVERRQGQNLYEVINGLRISGREIIRKNYISWGSKMIQSTRDSVKFCTFLLRQMKGHTQ